MNNQFLTFTTAFLLLAGSFSCSQIEDVQLSSEHKIISFEHENLINVNFLHDHMEIHVNENSTVSLMSLTWKAGTDLTSLAPVITIPSGATIMPASGSLRDFSDQVSYTVTAEDGTTLTYLILSSTEDQEFSVSTRSSDVTKNI